MATSKLYEVDRKEEIRQMGRGGNIITVYRIWATSAKGTYFHVDVPENALDQADQYLAPKAKQLDSI